MIEEPPTRSKANIVRAITLGVALLAAALLLRGPIGRWTRPAPPRGTALRLVAANQYEKAEPLLAECLDYNPTDVEVRVAMAEILVNRTEASGEAPARRALKLLEGNRYVTAASQATAHVLQGKAYNALHEIGKSEAAYGLALRNDPTVGEAGWLLLQIYYLEGRHDELRTLALRLARNEPDPRDRVRLLLEPCRPDARPLSDAGVVAMLEWAHRADPEDLPSNLAYFRALACDGSQIDRALAGLRALAARHPRERTTWNALLEALATTGQLDEMAATLAKVPEGLADDPAIVRHRGRLALDQGNYAAAIGFLQKAVAARPFDFKSLNRLEVALKRAGREQEAGDVRRRKEDHEQARLALRGIKSTKDADGYAGAYEKADTNPTFGLAPDLPLYRDFASIRERMGHPDEALAWHRLILVAAPDDQASRAAFDRLRCSPAGDLAEPCRR